MLHVQGLGKRYQDGAWGLRGVSATLRGGRFTALIGANGAGKTTLIHLLGELTAPTEGWVEGLEGATLGWCSQRAVIDWYLSAYDNVLLGARFAGYGPREAHRLTKEALAQVGLSKAAHKPSDALSGGQQQRVGIARAMVHNPDLLLLDEPTTGLDAGAADTLLRELKRRADAGALVLVSSHDLGLLDVYCDDVLFLADGRLVAHEPRDAFVARYADEEVVTVHVEGALSPETLRELHGVALRVLKRTPLELVVPRGTTLANLLDALKGVVVTDVYRRQPGLREAYFKLTEGGGDDA